MPTIDGGHYFLTTLIPVKVEPLCREDGQFTSPSHRLREVLETLPTAQQSPATVAAGFRSPFSRCTRTHFVRAVVIDQPMYNGRDSGDALVQGLRNVDLLAHEPVDRLSHPFLMFNVDFDARPSEPDGGLASWAEGLWEKTRPELSAIFETCVGFDAVADGRGFAAWIERCRLECTMSFNDYDVPSTPLPGYTIGQLSLGVGVGTAGLSALAAWALSAAACSLWWLALAIPLALLACLGVALGVLWIAGSKPFPTAAAADLPSVLKALHVQQRFALLATELQGVDDATLHARFGAFLRDVAPADVAAPTQPPGVIRSDGVSLVAHQQVPYKVPVA